MRESGIKIIDIWDDYDDALLAKNGHLPSGQRRLPKSAIALVHPNKVKLIDIAGSAIFYLISISRSRLAV